MSVARYEASARLELALLRPRGSNCQYLWIGSWSCRLGLGMDGVRGSFDELAVFEGGTVADERDEVGCVDRAPAGLGCLDELERHRQPGGPRPGSFGDLRTVSHGGEGRLDRVGRA